MGPEHHMFEIGLRDQHAVERVGVMARQFSRMLGVLAGDRQQLKTMGEDRQNDRLGKSRACRSLA